MTLEQFKASLLTDSPPPDATIELQALWHCATGDWATAHSLVQDESNSTSARVHAYLHRKEGDDWNARYWYRYAGMKPFSGTVEEEWDYLVSEFTGVIRPRLLAVSQ